MNILIVNPVPGGSGRCGIQILNEFRDRGHDVLIGESLIGFGFPALLRADLLILNEGLQGVHRKLLVCLGGIRRRRLRTICIIRNFRFVKSSFIGLDNVISKYFCVSRSLRDMFLEVYPQYSISTTVEIVIEPTLIDLNSLDLNAPSSVISKVLVPRVYRPQQRGLLEVAHHLGVIGHEVTVVCPEELMGSELFGSIKAPAYKTIGFQDDLESLYTRGDAVLVGGASPEGWGLIYNEALIFGRPSLICATSGGYLEQFVTTGVGCVGNLDCPNKTAQHFSEYLANFSAKDAHKLKDARRSWIGYCERFSYSEAFGVILDQ